MTLRAAALIALGAFAVHETRYLLLPDPHAAAGHGYLDAVPVVLALLLALAAGRTLAALGRRRAGGPPLTWAAATVSLLAVHGAQETLEHAVAGGGPVDAAGLLLVVPLSLVAGALVAGLLRRADRLLADATAPARAPRPGGTPSGAPLAVAGGVVAAAATGIARHLAGRAPPAFG